MKPQKTIPPYPPTLTLARLCKVKCRGSVARGHAPPAEFSRPMDYRANQDWNFASIRNGHFACFY